MTDFWEKNGFNQLLRILWRLCGMVLKMDNELYLRLDIGRSKEFK